MTVVYKQMLITASVQNIDVPVGAEFLHAAAQRDNIYVWYRCQEGAPRESKTIAVVGTGHPAPPIDEARYLGTAQLMGGELVFHVFVKL